MRSARQVVWLGLTPEPERELPIAVATLRRCAAPGQRGGAALAAWIADEERHIETLILHGTQRSWLRYLGEVTTLVADVGDEASPELIAAASHAAETVLEHHRMLIGLPGPAYDRVTTHRESLIRVIDDLRARHAARK